MSTSAHRLAERLGSRFGADGFAVSVALGEATLEVPAGELLETCRALRDEADFRFRQLVDLCGVDYLDFGKADWETSETTTSSGFSRGVQQRIPRRHRRRQRRPLRRPLPHRARAR